MLISLDWIKDFTKIPDLSPKELGEKLTMATCEVEEVNVVGDYWKKIKIVEVLKKDKHPEADKLNVVTFKLNDEESFKVICGASNVQVGMKTAFAPIGVTLPNGLTLEPKKIRGVLSEGMLCSEEELGFSESSEGILELPSDAPLGQDLETYYKQTSDIIFDVDNKSLTHRPDLWGHYGMAREFAAIFKNKLEDKFDTKWLNTLKEKTGSQKSPLTIKVEEDSAGIAYFGLSVDGISVGESPKWMKTRLNHAGLRPINSIVDISNYVMLELGMPLHIFDREKIEGDCVHIKCVSEKTSFQTLDEQERELVIGDTVICDSKKPLVLAGIMGGLNSGVSETTSNVFIEVANWQAAKVRSTSTRLGLRTDSSQRYEKTLDSLQCEKTLFRTLELILELNPNAKVIGKVEYDGDDLSKIETKIVTTSAEKISAVLGKKIEKSELVEILESLDFTILDKNGDTLKLEIPSFRATKDVDCAADIIEEIGRMIGYDNIAPSSPPLSVSPVRLSTGHSMERKIRDFMVLHGGSHETMTYPMIGESLLKKSLWPNDCEELQIINSLSRDNDRMRDSLIPSFLEVASINAKNMEEFKFFEIGRNYIPNSKSFCDEQNVLGIAFYSKTQSVFLDLLNNTERLLNSINVPFQISEKNEKFASSVVPADWKGIHPYEHLDFRVMGKIKASAFSVHPLLMRGFKMKGHLSFFIFDYTDLTKRALKEKVKYQPLNKFPLVNFDYTLSISKDENIGNILDVLNKIKEKEVAKHSVVGVFEVDELRHVTMRTVFHDKEKTLPSETIKALEAKTLQVLDSKGFKLKE